MARISQRGVQIERDVAAAASPLRSVPAVTCDRARARARKRLTRSKRDTSIAADRKTGFRRQIHGVPAGSNPDGSTSGSAECQITMPPAAKRHFAAGPFSAKGIVGQIRKTA
jgi:hypothetical protein